MMLHKINLLELQFTLVLGGNEGMYSNVRKV